MPASIAFTRRDDTPAGTQDAAIMALHRSDGTTARAVRTAHRTWCDPAGAQGDKKQAGEKKAKKFHGDDVETSWTLNVSE
jgi:hypothetical protein